MPGMLDLTKAVVASLGASANGRGWGTA